MVLSGVEIRLLSGDKMKEKLKNNKYFLRLIIVSAIIIFGVFLGFFAAKKFNSMQIQIDDQGVLDEMGIDEESLKMSVPKAVLSYGAIFGALSIGFIADKFLMDKWFGNNLPLKIFVGIFAFSFCVVIVGFLGLVPFYVYNIYKLICLIKS